MYCSACGAPLPPGISYCNRCGTNLKPKEETQNWSHFPLLAAITVIAIAGLGRIAGEKSLAALTNMLDNDPDIEIQTQAVVAIGRRPRDEAVPILIRAARSHPKMPVRKQAIKALGQTGDERAVAFFQELLAK